MFNAVGFFNRVQSRVNLLVDPSYKMFNVHIARKMNCLCEKIREKTVDESQTVLLSKLLSNGSPSKWPLSNVTFRFMFLSRKLLLHPQGRV